MQGVSRTLFEEVIFDAAGVKSLDWASYPSSASRMFRMYRSTSSTARSCRLQAPRRLRLWSFPQPSPTRSSMRPALACANSLHPERVLKALEEKPAMAQLL